MRFLSSLPGDGSARDAVILGAIVTGNIDKPVWVRVRVNERVEVFVSSDYLTIGGEHVPMSEHVAQAAVDSLDAVLPTPALVDAVEKAATIIPLPTWAPPAGQSRTAQTSSVVFDLCELRTRQLFEARGIQAGQLVAGHRKDVVLAGFMPPGRVVIYGARWTDGRRLQPLYPIPGHAPGHEDEYEDYSHGVRAVLDACTLDGKPASVGALLADPATTKLLGGPVAMLRYPTPTVTTAPSSTATASPADRPTLPTPAPSPAPATTRTGAVPVLYRGIVGAAAAVKELQRLLNQVDFPLPVDGAFGTRTEAAVKQFQLDHGLESDGRAGPITMKDLRAAAADVMPDTEPAPLVQVYPAIPAVLSDTEVDAVFGPLRWELAPRVDEPGAIRILNTWQKDNLRQVLIPQLRGVKGAPASCKIFLHRLLVEQTRAMFAAIEKDGDLPLIKSWAGTWNTRVVRGYEKSAHPIISRHTYAIAMDLNAEWNPFHGPAAKLGQVGTLIPILPRMKEHGYTSLGEHDPMHGEAFEVL